MLMEKERQTRTYPNSLVTEAELLQMDLTRAARSIIEELGTSCRGDSENDDGDVHTGEEPYETIDEFNEILSLGDALGRTPWGTNAKDHRSYYIAGTGHVMTVKPAESESDEDDDTPDTESKAAKGSIRRVTRFLKKWCKVNKWKIRQAEVSQRLDRHGEVFDMLSYDDDGYLRLTFAEPYDLEDDADSPYQDAQDENLPFFDSMGVRRTNDIRDRNVGYFIDGRWYWDLEYRSRPDTFARFDGQMPLVKHRKRNVTSLDRRGMTLYWPVREELQWAKRNLANLMRVSGFQAAFGAIRTISSMQTADAVKAHLSSLQGGTAGAGASETFDMPAPGVVTVPDIVKWEFPDTGKGNSNHIEVLVQILRAAASGMKLPEFMLTANVGEGNFASTLVSEGPFHKAMQFEQALMVQEDLEIIEQALWWAAEQGVDGITPDDVAAVMIEVKPPRVQTRNRKEDFEVNEKLFEISQLSGKSLLASEDRDFESEQKQIAIERKKEMPAPVAVSGPVAPPGPQPGLKADPMSEKGVMAGEPRETPEK